MPTDGKRFTEREPKFPSTYNIRDYVTKLDFDKMGTLLVPNPTISNHFKLTPLSIESSQAKTLSRVICEQVIYGRYSLGSLASSERSTFVEYGFARIKQVEGLTQLDEPLAILAAMQWVNNNAQLSMFECLQNDIGKHSHRQNGFEAYLAFHMRKVFETTPRLDSVFEFRSDFARRVQKDLSWLQEEFELVTVSTTNGVTNVSVVTPSCGPSSNIGFLANSGDEVLEWITANKDQFTFCFPQESAGPDVMFFMRSTKTKKLILALVQAKRYQQVEKHVLIRGVRTITPAWLWKSRNKDVRLFLRLPATFWLKFDFSI